MLVTIAILSTCDTAAVLSACCLALPIQAGTLAADDPQLVKARTIAFTTLICVELLRAHSCRSEHFTLNKIGFFSNRSMLAAFATSFSLLLAVLYVPALNPIFKTVPLDGTAWSLVLAFACLPLLASEFLKLARARWRRQ
jgi:Ca2+-transporting ATPase